MIQDLLRSAAYQELSGNDIELRPLSVFSDKVNSEVEKPKVAFSKGFFTWSYLFKGYIFHFLSLGATGVAFWLNCAPVYYFDQGTLSIADNTSLSMFQFAAKLHEMVIISSISCMAVQELLRRVTGPKGLPFGLLVSGFQVGQLAALPRASLWTAFRNHPVKIIALVLSTIYCASLSPSSAITIIPRLDWWPARNPFGPRTPQIVLDGDPTAIFPGKLGVNMTLMASCYTPEYSEKCPGAGYDTLKPFFASMHESGSQTSQSWLFMTETGSQTRRNVSFVHGASDGKKGFDIAAYTLSHSIVELTGLFNDYANMTGLGEFSKMKRPMLTTGSPEPVKMPIVQVSCHKYDYRNLTSSNSSTYPEFPTSVLDPDFLNRTLQINSSFSWPVSLAELGAPVPANTTQFSWVDTSSFPNSSNSGASIGAIYKIPYVDASEQQQSWIFPCLANAKWAATEITFDVSTSPDINHDVSAESVVNLVHRFPSSPAASVDESINITAQWADLLNVDGIAMETSVTSVSGDSSPRQNTTMAQSLIHDFIDQNGTMANLTADGYNAVSQIVASLLVEGLSRHAHMAYQPYIVWDDGKENITSQDLAALRTWDRESAAANTKQEDGEPASEFRQRLHIHSSFVTFDVMRYGYGYGIEHQPKLVIFSLAMLLTHAITVVIYLVFKCVRRQRSEDATIFDAWTSVEDVIALTLMSDPEKSNVRNIGAGVGSSETWEKIARIRVQDGNKLQLIVGHDQDMHGEQPEADKEYR